MEESKSYRSEKPEGEWKMTKFALRVNCDLVSSCQTDNVVEPNLEKVFITAFVD